MNESMQKLIDAIQKASPIVWQAAYRQVWIEFGEACFGVIFFIVCGLLFQKWVRTWEDEELHGLGNFIGYVISGISIVCLLFACEVFLNPNFAAIKELKGLL